MRDTRSWSSPARRTKPWFNPVVLSGGGEQPPGNAAIGKPNCIKEARNAQGETDSSGPPVFCSPSSPRGPLVWSLPTGTAVPRPALVQVAVHGLLHVLASRRFYRSPAPHRNGWPRTTGPAGRKVVPRSPQRKIWIWPQRLSLRLIALWRASVAIGEFVLGIRSASIIDATRRPPVPCRDRAPSAGTSGLSTTAKRARWTGPLGDSSVYANSVRVRPLLFGHQLRCVQRLVAQDGELQIRGKNLARREVGKQDVRWTLARLFSSPYQGILMAVRSSNAVKPDKAQRERTGAAGGRRQRPRR